MSIIHSTTANTLDKMQLQCGTASTSTNFGKAYDSLRRKVLYNILIACNTLWCLSETYNNDWVSKYLSDIFPIKNCLQKGDTLLSLLFNFVLEYTIRTVQPKQEGLKVNEKHQLLVYADEINVLCKKKIHTVQKTEALLVTSKETGLEVNVE